MSGTKVGDVVRVTASGSEFNAEVTKTYEDVDQKYVDVKVLDGGPNRGAAYQTVGPKAGKDSVFHFETLTAAEQKAVRGEVEPEPAVPVTPTPNQAPKGPDGDTKK